MLLGIEQVIHGLTSMRGSERTFHLFSNFFNVPVPSFNSVRSWVYRFGLYMMQSECERRDDWIFILDHTVQLGQRKCLLILGIPEGRLKTKGYALRHQDVTVLTMDVVTSSTGEIVAEQLEKAAKKAGTPKQILSDHGSDIKKGVRLYREERPSIIYTYDVTHKMAALLKQELQKDEKWLSFLKQCGKSCKSLKQTNLYFLAPPRQRTKARYSSVAPQIQWAQKVINWQERGDYTEIDRSFVLDQQTIAAVEDEYGDSVSRLLRAMPNKTYAERDTFTKSIVEQIGNEAMERITPIIYLAAEQGRRKFFEKLGWVVAYKEELIIYAQMIDLTTLVQEQVKQEGLNQASYQKFEKNIADISLSPRACRLAKAISTYLRTEGEQMLDQQTLLGTSDIIESVIGKYKYFSSGCSIQDIGKMILTIPVFTTQLTCGLVKTAMESVQALDINKWADDLLGKSALSKRRTLSYALENDTKNT